MTTLSCNQFKSDASHPIRFLSDLAGLLALRLGADESLRECGKLITNNFSDGCLIAIFDSGENAPRVVTGIHRSAKINQVLEGMEGHRLDVSQCAGLSVALCDGQPFRQNNRKNAGLEKYLPLMQIPGAGNLLPDSGYFALPLRHEDRILGALVLLFEEPPLELPVDANLLAALVSAILSGARLLEGAKEALAIRSTFVSVASHELKTPLTSLLLSFQQIRKLLDAAESVRNSQTPRLLTIAEQQLWRIERLIDDFLDLSRISRGGLLLSTESFDLSEAISEVVARFREVAPRKVPLNIQIASGVTGEWDRFRIEQVVQNLLSNAAKYGEGRPIDVTLRATDKWAEISVRDYGIGIASADRKNIFRLFERAKVNPHVGGLGIGLYVVQELVHMHGGTVDVESTPGKGAKFSVRLPIIARLDVNAAIEVHLRWKKRISSFIEGICPDELKPEQIRPDKLCTLGNWIYRILARDPQSREMTDLRDVHQKFHETAAKVIETFAATGRTEAERLLLPGSEYATLSNEIIERLGKMKLRIEDAKKAS